MENNQKTKVVVLPKGPVLNHSGNKIPMKKPLLTIMLSLTGLFANAQVIPSAYDSVQDARMTKVQMHLERFSESHEAGATLWFIGLTGIVAGAVFENPYISIGGGAMGFIGSCIMISAPKHVGKAARVSREKYDYNL